MPTIEEIQKYREKYKKDKNHQEEVRLKELTEKGLTLFDESQVPQKYCDHPNTMENSTATFFWIVVMVVGSLFKGNWMIWIIATVVWAKFITRHNK